MTAIIEISRHALMVTSFVAVMMLVVEYINVLTQGKWQKHLATHRWGQYLLAALLGATPGCLGAFAVVGMYAHGTLTHGAVIAAIIATMGDETFVMLAMIPGQACLMMAVLLVLGILAGALSDLVARRWIPLVPEACGEMRLHADECCNCFPKGKILQQWKRCSMARGVLSVALLLFFLGLATGQLGAPTRDWIRITLLILTALALFIVSTVPDHFLEKHLWEHVALKHVPKILLWTLGALIIIYLLTEHLQLEGALEKGKWFLLIAACLLGLIPESGPHLVFVTLFAQGHIPFSVLLASSIVQDGHGMLPMLAHSRRSFAGIKTVNFLVGLLIGSVVLLIGK